MNGHVVTLFLSTGRCGTQRITYVLKSLFGTRVEITHEPLRAAYAPRRLLRNPNYASLIARQPRVLAHIENIKAITNERPYIETGWPCYGAVPYYRDVFGDRLRIVHLTRNPVHVALSLLTHGWFPEQNSSRPQIVSPHFALGALTPDVPGIAQTGYRQRWETMNSYERALFHWTEVHLYALEVIESLPASHRHFTRHETLTDPDDSSWRDLCDFLELGQHVGFPNVLRKRVDSYQLTTDRAYDWRAIFDHQETLRLAERFGYDLNEIDDANLARRYFPADSPR